MATAYEVIILGAGTAGISAAHAAAEAGARVLLLNDGPPTTACAAKNCMPSKALLAATTVAHMACHAAPFGVVVSGPVVADFTRIVAQVKEQVAFFTQATVDGVMQAVTDGKFAFLSGRAVFAPGGGVIVNGQVLTAQRYVLATGSIPAIPPIEGLAQVPYLTSDDILTLPQAPQSLIMLGAGPVGLELAEVFARVGTEVLLVDDDTLLPDFDPEFGNELTRYLAAEPRLTLWTGAQVRSVHGSHTSPGVTMVIDVEGQTREQRAEAVMVATGRKPALEGLGLEHVGLTLEKGTLKVNAAMQTTHPGIFAAGDLVKPQILHIAAEEGRVAGHNAARGVAEQTVDYARQDLAIIFTSLTAARTGLTASQAGAQGCMAVTASDTVATSGRGVTDKDAFGLWTLVAEKATGTILGAQILEKQADAAIHLVKLAMEARLTVADVARMVVYHPTRAERFKGLAQTLCQQLGQSDTAPNDL